MCADLTLPSVPALPERRDTRQAMLRGARGRCPACGTGRLFSRYLKVADHCAECGEDLRHQRTDDGPAYLTILVVAHLVGPILLIVFVAWRPDPLVLVATFCVGATVLSLLLLPVFKGAMVGFQWAHRMHGFGGEEPHHD
ncbi:MAG: hypothetical protein DI498_08805 [Paracoccus denitrificans]|nr:MAG: hypothetical protein DI498_08805 [Paracoccus denitrificans]PZO84210.1 MAG: hypothetical protein DI633_08805 [Paracoccus denitrificans]